MKICNYCEDINYTPSEVTKDTNAHRDYKVWDHYVFCYVCKVNIVKFSEFMDIRDRFWREK